MHSFTCMTDVVQIISIERPMRGGSQSYLVRGDDRHYYVAKFRNNPQGNRTLANEWMASQMLHRLGASAPQIRRLYLSAELQRSADLCFSVKSSRVPVSEGIHLGSQCPVDVTKKAVFDFLPLYMYSKVDNLSDIALALVFDRWVGQLDSRQVVFYRPQNANKSTLLHLSLIDHGYCFGALEWNPNLAAPGHGFLIDKRIYGLVQASEFRMAIDRLQRLSSMDIEDAILTAPKEFLSSGDEQALSELLVKVQRRQSRLEELVDLSFDALKVQMKDDTRSEWLQKVGLSCA